MAATPYNASGEYQPDSVIGVPALFAWPPRPLRAIRWLLYDLLFPWGYFFIALAFLTWAYLTPSLVTMATFELGWIAMLWLRNAALLTLVAGGLHWWLYLRRGQQKDFKFHDTWPATDIIVLRPDSRVLAAARPNPLSVKAAVPSFLRTLMSMRDELSHPETWTVLEKHLGIGVSP